jgi:hypothetical protein
MRRWQQSSRSDVGDGDGKQLEPGYLQLLLKVPYQICRFRPFSDTDLYCHLPNSRHADRNLAVLCLNRSSGNFGKQVFVHDSPEQGVSIQQ